MPEGFDRDIYLNVSVLFVAQDSIYKSFPGLDVWDEERNALNWPGGNPGVFHPPCRLWSRWLRHLSTAPIEEKQLALWSVDQVRRWGGVLEHPACSLLWDEAGLPKPGTGDKHGISIAVYQQWWGHKLQKATWLYICGAETLPEIPFVLGEAERKGRWNHQNNVKPFAHLTPAPFAQWLIQTAELCHV